MWPRRATAGAHAPELAAKPYVYIPIAIGVCAPSIIPCSLVNGASKGPNELITALCPRLIELLTLTASA